MPVEHLTQKSVDAHRWAGRTLFIRDTEVKGLILSVNKSSKTWKVQRDMWQDRRVTTVRHTLGTADEISLKDARNHARIVLSQIASGANPNERPKVEAQGDGPETWTVARLWDEYIAYIEARNRSATTIASMRYQLDKYLADWRRKPIAELRKSTCRERHQFITANNGPTPANQVMRSLRADAQEALDRAGRNSGTSFTTSSSNTPEGALRWPPYSSPRPVRMARGGANGRRQRHQQHPDQHPDTRAHVRRGVPRHHKRRAAMTGDIAPTRFQQAVLKFRGHVNILNAGGRGSGKSFSLILDLIDHCRQHGADARPLVLRESWAGLQEL